MHELYLQYCNLPKIHVDKADIEYLSYLDKFNSFFYIQECHKESKAYEEYVEALWEYLSGGFERATLHISITNLKSYNFIDFFGRIQPLVDLKDLISEWQKTFAEKWEAGTIPGWKKIDSSSIK